MTLSEFLQEEIEAGSFPGAAALVGNESSVEAAAAAGRAAITPGEADLTEEMLFDLASLTKPLATGALFAVSDLEPGLLPGRFFPAWKATRYEGITLGALLTHTSGLPAWYPLYARGEGAESYRRTLATIEPEAAPGAQVIYSDLNFLLLGEILERHFGAPFERAFAELVARPAGSGALFAPPDPLVTAATEKGDATERRMTAELGLTYERFRTGVVRGEVHDGNALRRDFTGDSPRLRRPGIPRPSPPLGSPSRLRSARKRAVRALARASLTSIARPSRTQTSGVC